jgi:predicted regulator of Ras-like GTPase activity (Roadblock/LC7/MglB family)
MTLRDRLEGMIGEVEGALAASLVARDGMPVDSVWDDSLLDLEIVAAEMLAQVQFLADSDDNLSAGPVRLLSVSTNRHTVLLVAVSADYYLLLVLKPSANYGRARYEIRRAGLRFLDEIGA